MKQFDITEVELLRAAGFVKDKPKKLPAKYYDPSTGKSWTGRGACPKWLIGKNLDDYLIRPAPEPWWPGRARSARPRRAARHRPDAATRAETTAAGVPRVASRRVRRACVRGTAVATGDARRQDPKPRAAPSSAAR